MGIILPVILSCSQANILVARVYSKDLPQKYEAELVNELKAIAPKACQWRLPR